MSTGTGKSWGSLRTRFVVGFVLAAVTPMAAVGWWARSAIAEQAADARSRRLDATVDAAERQVRARVRRDARAVQRLCEPDSVLARWNGEAEAPASRGRDVRAARALVRSIRDALGLDLLEVVDAGSGAGRGTVLASAGGDRVGARAYTQVQALRWAGGDPFVQRVPTPDGRRRALLIGCEQTRGETRTAVLAGRLLDDEFVSSLLGDVAPLELVLRTGPEPSGSTGHDDARRVHTFRDAHGDPAARLAVVVGDHPVRAQVATLDRGLAIAGVAGLAGALLLGTLLAFRVTRPLQELESAARRVGGGDLESTIDVRHGGEVGRALSAFNHMTRELRATREQLLRAERIAAWRDIARRLAHEIKNPLSPIQVSIETMRKTYAKRHADFEEIFEESTQTILEEVERLKRIVGEFSRFARMPRPNAEWLDISGVIEHVVGLHQGGDVDVRTHIEEVPQVRADREQLTQVFVNLVQNAIDAARAAHEDGGGEVEITVEPDPESEGVVIAVADNGSGIPAESRGEIFEPYYTTKDGGSGLGLAIVQRIISDHGGHLELADAAEGGTVVRVTLRPEGPPPDAEISLSDTVLPLTRRRE